MADCYTKFTVTRYEWYPSSSPEGVCVGFTAKCYPNNRASYWDTIVASSSAADKTDSEVITLAWTALSGTVVPWAETEMLKSSLIGTDYITISGST